MFFLSRVLRYNLYEVEYRGRLLIGKTIDNREIELDKDSVLFEVYDTDSNDSFLSEFYEFKLGDLLCMSQDTDLVRWRVLPKEILEILSKGVGLNINTDLGKLEFESIASQCLYGDLRLNIDGQELEFYARGRCYRHFLDNPLAFKNDFTKVWRSLLT